MTTPTANRAKTVVPIGPFPGGLNQLEDPRFIGDDQLAVCQNVDIGRSGELILRAGLRQIFTLGAAFRLIGTTQLSNSNSRVYGRFIVAGAISYIDGPNILSGGVGNTIASPAAGKTEKVLQYGNAAWFVPKDVQGGGPALAQGLKQDLGTNAETVIPAMPRGSGGVVFKDRMFIFGPIDATNTLTQRVFYSAAGDMTSWPAANFFDVNAGDGEGVTAAYPIGDALIFFKRHSTYALFYDTDPGLGVLRKVSTQIGATGPDAVTQFENSLYIIDDKTIYRVQNLLFVDIGKNLNLKTRRLTTVYPTDVSDFIMVFGTKILCSIYTGRATPMEYYVYNTEIDAWTQYTFAQQPERFYKVTATTSFEDYVAANHTSGVFYGFSPFSSAPPPGDYPTGIVPVTVRTKKYSFGNSGFYKRLFWWGLDIYLTGSISLQVIADTINASAVATLNEAGNTQPAFLKAFIPTRGRYLEFLLTANSANQSLLILSGSGLVSTAAGSDKAVAT